MALGEMMDTAGVGIVSAGETFGARLREAIRERLGPDQEREFARRIGMDPTQLSRTLNGKIGRVPEPETLLRYAKGLNLPLITLLGWIYPVEEQVEAAPSPDDPLWLMVERVRRNPEMMRDLRRAEEINKPEVFHSILEAVADAWLANLRMGLRVNDADRDRAAPSTS